MRLDCETSVEAQPATGQAIFYDVHEIRFIASDLSCSSSRYQLTFFSISFSGCRYNCPANCLNKKGKVWGTLFYDVVSLAYNKKTYATIHTLHFIFTSIIIFCVSNQVFAELLYILVPLTTTEEWWTPQGWTRCHSLSELQRTASSPPGRLVLLIQHVSLLLRVTFCAIRELFKDFYCFLFLKHHNVFYSKYKPGNAFVVAKTEGK